jgi:hypothetical protein
MGIDIYEFLQDADGDEKRLRWEVKGWGLLDKL